MVLLPMISVRSFAKLNIALDVLDKRPDGYHNIESVIQTISLHDEMTIALRDGVGVSVRVSDPKVPPGEGNLAYKACVLFIEGVGPGLGVDIDIDKRIPMQAGLGGGSSNAAAALTGMNELLGRPLDRAALLNMAATLGSDVPFFLTGGTARVCGRGEIVSPLPECGFDYVVIKPDFGISTAWAYGQLSDGRTPVSASHSVEAAIRASDRGRVSRVMSNDFTEVAKLAYAEVTQIRDDLAQHGTDSSMLAGSGSAVFGMFLDGMKCDSAYEALRSKYSRVFRARTVMREELRPGEFAPE